MSKITIGMAQLNSNDDVSRNLNQIAVLLDSLQAPVDIVFFPENSLFFRIKENDVIQFLNLESPELKSIAEICSKKNIHVHLGSVALTDKVCSSNSSIIITPQKKILKSYSKIHLFDIQLNQEKAIRESDCFQRGVCPSVFTLKGWRFGQSICYDIRFSELYRYYNSIQADVLLVPAAFLKKTGQAHWHVLNRARAIENQAYVISSAQMGPHVSSHGTPEQIPPRETYGHSLCISPWGETVAEINDTPTIQIVELDRANIDNVKKQIPMDNHRFLQSSAWKADEIIL